MNGLVRSALEKLGLRVVHLECRQLTQQRLLDITAVAEGSHIRDMILTVQMVNNLPHKSVQNKCL